MDGRIGLGVVERAEGWGGLFALAFILVKFKYLCIVFYLKILKRIFGEKTLSALFVMF